MADQSLGLGDRMNLVYKDRQIPSLITAMYSTQQQSSSLSHLYLAWQYQSNMSYSSTRIGYTAPNPYDQIFVLSQRLINDSFAFLHDHADERTPMIHFYKKIREEYIDMYLGASTIQLQAIGIDPQLYFMINVSSGTLAVWPDDESEETKKYPLEGWVLAYPVKLCAYQVHDTAWYDAYQT